MTDAPLSAPASGPLRDQRTMTGGRTHRSVEEIERAWDEWVAEHGLGGRRRNGDYSTDLRPSRKRVVAYVSGGKWIADCPVCNGGIAVWSENPRGVCLDCGTIFRVDHPTVAEILQAETLLGARPDPLTRHWHRHRDETLDDLAQQNAETLTRDEEQRVAVDDVVRVLGPDALLRLREAGLVNDDLERLREAGRLI